MTDASKTGARIFAYVNFDGECEEAFKFYEKVLGSKAEFMGRYKDMPDGDQYDEASQNRIMHVSMKLADGNVLMGCDTMEPKYTEVTAASRRGANRVELSLWVNSNEDADRVFAALSEGGKVEMPLEKQFWGDYFGVLQDKFGVAWQVLCEGKKDSS